MFRLHIGGLKLHSGVPLMDNSFRLHIGGYFLNGDKYEKVNQ